MGIRPINNSGGETEPLLSLQLCCDCLVFLEKNAEKVVNIRKPLETVEIVKCLTRVVYFMLNC